MRHGQPNLMLNVPDDDRLLNWATTACKPLAGHVTFFKTNRLTAREAVDFAAGHCVGYHETCASSPSAERLALLPSGLARKCIAL